MISSSVVLRMTIVAITIQTTFGIDTLKSGPQDPNMKPGDDPNKADAVLVFTDMIDIQGACENEEDCGNVLHLAKLLLHPSEFDDAVEVVHNSNSLGNFLANLFAFMDIGVDLAGDPTGLAGNGELDRHEIANRIFATTRGWQAIKDDTWLATVDKDDDGLVSFTELEKAIEYGSDDKHKNSMIHMGEATKFLAADKNRDKFLSDVDVVCFRNPIWEQRMHMAAAEIFLVELDTNHDDTITYAEYVSASGSLSNETLERVPAKTLYEEFKRLDSDDSGDIDTVELKLMPEARSMSILASGVDFLMKKTDKDNSNTIDAHELEELAKLLEQDLMTEQPPSRDSEDL